MKYILPYTKENRDYFARDYQKYFNTGEMTENKGKYIVVDGENLFRTKNYMFMNIPNKPYKMKHQDGYEYDMCEYRVLLSVLAKHYGYKKIGSYKDIK